MTCQIRCKDFFFFCLNKNYQIYSQNIFNKILIPFWDILFKKEPNDRNSKRHLIIIFKNNLQQTKWINNPDLSIINWKFWIHFLSFLLYLSKINNDWCAPQKLPSWPSIWFKGFVFHIIIFPNKPHWVWDIVERIITVFNTNMIIHNHFSLRYELLFSVRLSIMFMIKYCLCGFSVLKVGTLEIMYSW